MSLDAYNIFKLQKVKYIYINITTGELGDLISLLVPSKCLSVVCPPDLG